MSVELEPEDVKVVLDSQIADVNGEKKVEVDIDGRQSTVDIRPVYTFERQILDDLIAENRNSNITGAAVSFKGKWIHGWLRANGDEYINGLWRNYQYFLKYIEGATENISNISTYEKSSGTYDSMYRYLLVLEDIGLVERYRRESVSEDEYDFNVPEEFRTRTYVRRLAKYASNQDLWNNPIGSVYQSDIEAEPTKISRLDDDFTLRPEDGEESTQTQPSGSQEDTESDDGGDIEDQDTENQDTEDTDDDISEERLEELFEDPDETLSPEEVQKLIDDDTSDSDNQTDTDEDSQTNTGNGDDIDLDDVEFEDEPEQTEETMPDTIDQDPDGFSPSPPYEAFEQQESVRITDFPDLNLIPEFIARNLEVVITEALEKAPLAPDDLDPSDFELSETSNGPRVGVIGPWGSGEATPKETPLDLVIGIENTSDKRGQINPGSIPGAISRLLPQELEEDDPFGGVFPSFNVDGAYESSYINTLKSEVETQEADGEYYTYNSGEIKEI